MSFHAYPLPAFLIRGTSAKWRRLWFGFGGGNSMFVVHPFSSPFWALSIGGLPFRWMAFIGCGFGGRCLIASVGEARLGD